MQLDIVIGGALVGLVVGLTGMGGGALMTPMLVLVFGVRPLTAVSSDLVASAVMKPIGGAVHLRNGTVMLRVALWLVLGSVPSAFLVVVAARQLLASDALDGAIETGIGIALVLASVGIVSKGLFRRGAGRPAASGEIAVHRARTVAIGVFGGVMVGLTSVGSGSLMMVLLLLLYPALTAAQLVGTDLAQATPLVASAALAHVLFGDVAWGVTISLLAGAVPAVYVGARFSSRAPDHVIRPLLAAVLATTGVKLLGAPDTAVAALAAVLLTAYVGLQARHWWLRRADVGTPLPRPAD